MPMTIQSEKSNYTKQQGMKTITIILADIGNMTAGF